MIRITRSTYAPYGDDQKGEGETLMISAEVERNKIQYKPVYTRIFFVAARDLVYRNKHKTDGCRGSGVLE